MSSTKELWKEFARALGIPDNTAEASFRALTKTYSTPRRHYHALGGHIHRCIDLFHEVRRIADEPLAVEAALWTHDAHYDSKANDNEEQSIAWMRSFFERFGVLDKNLASRTAALIAATSHKEKPSGNDEKLVADIDLSILGAARMDFDRYEVGIRREYAWVPWPLFAEKRASILEGFLARPSIYHHEVFVEKYERQARENLVYSIQKLKRS